MAKILQHLKTPNLRHAEKYAKNCTSLYSLDQKTLFFNDPLQRMKVFEAVIKRPSMDV